MVFELNILFPFFSFFIAVISELIHYTTSRESGGVQVQMPLIQVIVPQVMNLKAQLRDTSKVLHAELYKFFFEDWIVIYSLIDKNHQLLAASMKSMPIIFVKIPIHPLSYFLVLLDCKRTLN